MTWREILAIGAILIILLVTGTYKYVDHTINQTTKNLGSVLKK